MARIEVSSYKMLGFKTSLTLVVTKGLAFGYLYGRLAHLPPISIAKAFTIWGRLLR